MSSNASVLAGFSAETLLGKDAHVIKEIIALRDDLRYTTKGSEVSLDDSFLRLQHDVDALPRIVLDMDVPPGTENEYLIRLSTAQEKVLDDCDRVLRRTLEFQSKLRNAERAIKKYKADFMSWYILSASYVIESHDVKFPQTQIKQLAEAEFSRLLDNLDVQIDNLINSVEHLIDEVRQHKKIQSEKHNLGKDQANASWTSKMANPNGIAPNRADDMAQGFETDEEEEEEDEDVPAFVSRRPQIGNSDNPTIGKSDVPKIVTSNQDLLDQAKPGDTVVLRFQDNVAPILKSIKDEVKITGPVTLPVVLAEPEQVVDFLNGDEDEPVLGGLVKDMEQVAAQGIPVVEHASAVAVVREILTDPSPVRNYQYQEPTVGTVVLADTTGLGKTQIATATMKPRKKLILTEDEDLM